MRILPENITDLDYNMEPLEYCKRYLDFPVSTYKIGPQEKEILRCSISTMEKATKEINEKFISKDFQYGNIEKGLNVLVRLSSENVNEKFFDRFLYNFSYLAHNININTLNNGAIINKCNYIERFSKKALTLNETIIMFSNITSKLSEWKKFVPPSFKLSEHYFNVIKEE